jgi:hypothetical protein
MQNFYLSTGLHYFAYSQVHYIRDLLAGSAAVWAVFKLDSGGEPQL